MEDVPEPARRRGRTARTHGGGTGTSGAGLSGVKHGHSVFLFSVSLSGFPTIWCKLPDILPHSAAAPDQTLGLCGSDFD